jgi:hypothetical protein
MGVIYNKVRPGGGAAFGPTAQAFVNFLIRHVGPEGVMPPDQDEQPAVRTAEAQEQLVGDKS